MENETVEEKDAAPVNEKKEIEEKEELSEEEKEAEESMEVDEKEEKEEERTEKQEGTSRKRSSTKPNRGDSGGEKKEAVTPSSDRPTRERKIVERFSVPSVARSSTPKPLSIQKGPGTQVKDIPNVAFKLSKRKFDDNLQMLHMIVFGKKAKPQRLKRNLGQFSGYVWIENEEKEKAKVKEKIDKCVKEKLVDFCDLLNIPITRTTARKVSVIYVRNSLPNCWNFWYLPMLQLTFYLPTRNRRAKSVKLHQAKTLFLRKHRIHHPRSNEAHPKWAKSISVHPKLRRKMKMLNPPSQKMILMRMMLTLQSKKRAMMKRLNRRKKRKMNPRSRAIKVLQKILQQIVRIQNSRRHQHLERSLPLKNLAENLQAPLQNRRSKRKALRRAGLLPRSKRKNHQKRFLPKLKVKAKPARSPKQNLAGKRFIM